MYLLDVDWRKITKHNLKQTNLNKQQIIGYFLFSSVPVIWIKGKLVDATSVNVNVIIRPPQSSKYPVNFLGEAVLFSPSSVGLFANRNNSTFCKPNLVKLFGKLKKMLQCYATMLQPLMCSWNGEGWIKCNKIPFTHILMEG